MYATINDLRMRALALDEAAAHLAHRVSAISWQGFAADAMRRRASRAIAELSECARRHREAADAIDRHRRAALTHPVGQLAHAAIGTIDELGSAVGHLL